jgi:hypothetical protein
MKRNIPANPLDIGLLRPVGHVPGAKLFPHDFVKRAPGLAATYFPAHLGHLLIGRPLMNIVQAE